MKSLAVWGKLSGGCDFSPKLSEAGNGPEGLCTSEVMRGCNPQRPTATQDRCTEMSQVRGQQGCCTKPGIYLISNKFERIDCIRNNYRCLQQLHLQVGFRKPTQNIRRTEKKLKEKKYLQPVSQMINSLKTWIFYREERGKWARNPQERGLRHEELTNASWK